MSRPSDKLIPAKFLTLVAHLAIVITILWSSRESVKICLPEEHTQRAYDVQHMQLVLGMSLSITIILIELLAFLLGLTMFSQSSALLSIASHGSASCMLCYLVMDGMQCGWYWMVFGLFTIPPIIYDFILVADIGWSPLLILAGISTTIGSSLTVGYNIGVVNAPAEIIKVFCNESVQERYEITLEESAMDILWSAVVSIFIVGGVIGSLGGSWFADKIGRKGGIVINTILATMSAVCFLSCKSANSVELLILGRLLVGLSSGLATCIVPMYLMELAPLRLRGPLGVLCPLGVTFGVLVGQVLSLNTVLGTKEQWPQLLGFYLIFVLLSALVLPFLPESPKYLYVIKKQTQLALDTLERIRGVEQDCDSADVLELQAEQSSEKREWSIGQVLSEKKLLLPILLVCSMQAGQQFAGINAVFYYSVSIFMRAGLSDEDSQLATIGAGVINLGMAVISIYVMSRFNRRFIFQLSCATAAVFLALLGIAITYIESVSWMPYVSIIGVLGFVLTYGIGLGPIPYFIGSELFEVGPRPSAMALGSMANWGGNFIIGMTFPTLQRLIGAASFFIFSAVAVGLCVFVRMYLPETRGRDPTLIAQQCRNGLSRPRPPMSPVSSLSTDDTA